MLNELGPVYVALPRYFSACNKIHLIKDIYGDTCSVILSLVFCIAYIFAFNLNLLLKFHDCTKPAKSTQLGVVALRSYDKVFSNISLKISTKFN